MKKFFGYSALIISDLVMITFISFSSLPGPALALILCGLIGLWYGYIKLVSQFKEISSNETTSIVLTARNVKDITDVLETSAVFHRIYTLLLIIMMGCFFASKSGLFLQMFVVATGPMLICGYAALFLIILLFSYSGFQLYRAYAYLKFESSN